MPLDLDNGGGGWNARVEGSSEVAGCGTGDV